MHSTCTFRSGSDGDGHVDSKGRQGQGGESVGSVGGSIIDASFVSSSSSSGLRNRTTTITTTENTITTTGYTTTTTTTTTNIDTDTGNTDAITTPTGPRCTNGRWERLRRRRRRHREV